MVAGSFEILIGMALVAALALLVAVRPNVPRRGDEG